MKAYKKEIKFPSTEHTYLKDITEDVNAAIKQAGVEVGFVFVNTKHTTLGIVVNEIAEPNLLQDVLKHTLVHVHEDRRSTRVAEKGDYEQALTSGSQQAETVGYKYPTTDYTHRCQDNPYCDEIDEDYNAASHIRSLLYSHPSVVVPITAGKLDLGKYQQVAVFEFDGRDGSGKNPIRQRTVQIWVCPAEEIINLE